MQTGHVTLKQIGRIAKAKPQWWEKEEFFESPEKDQSSVDYSTSQGDASPGVASSASTATGSYVAGSLKLSMMSVVTSCRKPSFTTP